MDSNQFLDLDVTLCCGQVFRWHKRDVWWYGVAGDRVFKIRQTPDKIEFENASNRFVKHYLAIELDLPQVYADIDKDRTIHKAIRRLRGLRVINQDPWECLISYICATYKNIPAIQQMLANLCNRFGKPTEFENRIFHAFPTAQTLSSAKVSDLKACGLGYRAKYVQETAKRVVKSQIDFGKLMSLDYENAKNYLIDLPGVGPKVADCTLLFSLGKTEAFPVDVWIKRALLKHYRRYFPKDFIRKASSDSLSSSQYHIMNTFGRNYFGKYAGYAQEYLYHYERARFTDHDSISQ